MNKINIMILTTSLHVGGGEKHIYNLVSGMDEGCYKFVVVCLYELGGIGRMLLKEKQNVAVYHNVMKNKYDAAGAMRLLHVMKGEDIHILFMVHTPVTLFWGLLCARLAGIRLTVSRSPTTNPSGHVKRWKIVNYFLLGYISRIVAQAYEQREYLVNQVGADPEKISVIHNGVDIDRFSRPADTSQLRESLGVPLDAPIVGIVGRLAPQKGHTVFLRAARIILDSFPDVRFLIAGEGKERGNLEQMTAELSVRGNVQFLGMVSNISRIVPLFDIGVLASMPVGETFSNAILEYMAASKPVVATNVGSIAEQVKDGETGYLVPHNNPGALAEAILKLLRNRRLADKMGASARAMAEEQFTMQKMIEKYDGVFRGLLT